MSTFNDMQLVKRMFFTMRNGALADNMRRQGAPYKIIFGVNLPQLVQIAAETPHNASLAQSLWENQSTRESMLLAPMIYPKDELTIETALQWAKQSPTAEIADVLCHRLLRHVEFAEHLVDELIQSTNDIERYTALRLLFNLLPSRLGYAKECAEKELHNNCALTASLCKSLISEIDFILE